MIPAPAEQVISLRPFTVAKRIRWAECDPAGVVHTANFSHYVLSAAELFYEAILGAAAADGGTLPVRRGDRPFGTPTRALSFDFRLSLWPDDIIHIRLAVAGIRTRTYMLDATALTEAGAVAFTARLTPICVAAGERRAIEIPPAFRAALQRYRDEMDGLV